MNNKIEEKLKELNIESIEEFEPNFYISNLTNGYSIKKKAIDNLFSRYDVEDLIFIENYNEIGIVEYVAKGQYYIKDNKIIIEED